MGGGSPPDEDEGQAGAGLTFPGSDEEGGAPAQIMQMKLCFDPKRAGLAANVSPVVKGRDSLGEIPAEGVRRGVRRG